mmetsp:Transcript_31197/g.47775  ORF Transcript_31197/g.47775 Transcript_31197/m.47775 type:complete len:166 (+) Transcript_31197:1920-2417(+)
MMEALFDLTLLTAITFLSSLRFRSAMHGILKEGRIDLNTSRLLTIFMVGFVGWHVHLCLSEFQHFPFSTQLIAWVNILYQNVALFMLPDTNYCRKYHFYMFKSSFLYYFYLKTYLYSNVTLTNIVYVTFTAYQLCHNLFKFSFQYELIAIHLQRGNLAAILPASI